MAYASIASICCKKVLILVLLFQSATVLAWQKFETETELIVNTVFVQTTTVWQQPPWFHTSTFATVVRSTTITQPAPPSTSVTSEHSTAQQTFASSVETAEQSSTPVATSAAFSSVSSQASTHVGVPSSTSVQAAPTSTGVIDPAWSGSSFKEAVLNSTNTWRSRHDAQPLVWSDTLASFAYNHSKSCIWEHTKDGPYGENLALGYASAAAAIDAWGDEEKDYDYNAAQFSETTGHFTALVWKATTQVGCGAFQCSNDTPNGAKGMFFTCEYLSAGNVPGEFKENVVQSSDGGALSVGKRSEAAKAVAGLKTRALSLAGLVGAYWIH